MGKDKQITSRQAGNRVHFDHEKLNVYQSSLEFIGWLSNTLSDQPKSNAIIKQLDRASISIPLNIAEGNGKYTSADRCRFFDIARGSALECAASLDVLVVQGIKTEAEITAGKKNLNSIVSMLVGLIKTNSNRVHDNNGKQYQNDFDEK